MFTDFQNTFDATNALCAMFLWLLFNFLSTMVNCDLQRMIESSLLVRHLVALLAFFFLFTLIDTNNKAPVSTILLKTLGVYVLFLFTTKSKAYFVIPILVLLMIDQVFKKHYEYTVANQDPHQANNNNNKLIKWHAEISQHINTLIISIIIVGMFHYMYLQKIEYQDKFSLKTFFFAVNNKCKSYHPDYSKFIFKSK